MVGRRSTDYADWCRLEGGDQRSKSREIERRERGRAGERKAGDR